MLLKPSVSGRYYTMLPYSCAFRYVSVDMLHPFASSVGL